MSRILLVEDDTNTCFGLSEILKEEGYDVIVAEDAEQALQKLGDDVEVLLTDLRLPDLSGFELFHRVKRQHPDIQTIIMTAFSNPELQRRAIEEGVYRWVMKPLNLERLLTDIQEAVGCNLEN